MPALSTPALVLRRADYKDYDRMVTLFTPEYGRIDAIARGCRRSKSPLTNATEPFAYGEYQLYLRKDRYTVNQVSVRQNHLKLTERYEYFLHGAYWLRLLEAAVMPEAPAEGLFLITLKALAYLSYSDLPPELLTMAFEMHLMAQLGLQPRVDSCLLCGRRLEGEAHFDAILGGAICTRCASDSPVISNGARRIIMKLPRTAFEKIDLVLDHPDWKEAAYAFRQYVIDRLHVEDYAPALAQIESSNSVYSI